MVASFPSSRVLPVLGSALAATNTGPRPDGLGPLSLWLDASLLGLANGASVVAIPDNSGNGLSLTQATVGRRGTAVTGGLNGRDTVQLDGVDDFYFNEGNLWPVDAAHFFAVVKPGSSGEYFSEHSAIGGNLRWHFYNNGGGFRRWDAGPTKAVTAGQWTLVEYQANGANESLCVNNGAPASGAARPANTNREFVLGSLSKTGPLLPQALGLAEFFMFPQVLTAEARLAALDYIRRKWLPSLP